MAGSSTENTDLTDQAACAPDRLSVRRWLAAYGTSLLALAIPALMILHRMGRRWTDLFANPRAFFLAPAHEALKLLIFALYLSLACTLLPLPTGWMVSALATRDVGLSDSMWVTVAVVATIGAACTMVANLHDYHMFTWLLRYQRISRVRQTRLYRRAHRWFSRRPFWLLVLFNLLPVPVDVVRILSATGRYPLRPFAMASFLGRWIRYAAIAGVTFAMGNRGWWLAVGLLALAVVLGLWRLILRVAPGRG